MRLIITRSGTMDFICQTHKDQLITSYCMTHDVPCCSKCKQVSHKPTCDLQVINSNKNGKDFGHKMTNAIKCMNKTIEVLDALHKESCQNEQHLLKQKEKFEQDLRQFRQRLDAYIDEIENALRNQFNDMHDRELNILKQREVGIIKKRDTVNRCISDIEEMARKETDFKLYVNLSKIVNTYTVIEKHISSIKEKLHYVTLSFKTSEILDHLKGLNDAHTYIERTISTNEFEVSAFNTTQEYFQKVSEFIIEKDTDFKSPSDMCIMPDGTIVVVNLNNRRLVVYDQDGMSDVEMELSHNPLHLTGNGTDTVAMTLVNETKIVILNITERKVLHQICMQDESYGITYCKGKLVVNCKTKGLHFLGLNYEIESVLPNIKGKLLLCAHENGNIIYGELLSNALNCIDNTGKRIFRCSPPGLEYLNGITISKSGEIYITGYLSNTVHAIDKNGKSSHIILSDKHGVNLPCTICADDLTNGIILINNDGRTVEIFSPKK